ncbi:MAG: deoxynucleoside kinase [Bacteroidota bacterium]
MHIPQDQRTQDTSFKHVAVAGNIGAGKTTLVQMLAAHYDWKAHLEAVDHNPYLEDFYHDMHKWAFPLQIYFLHSRFRQVVEVRQADYTVIQDRTIYEDAHIFAQNLRQSGYLSERDFQNYFSLFQSMTDLIQAPDLLIYLRTSIPKLLKQIARRGRSYEQNINVSYLEDLNRNYEDWIGHYTGGKLLIIETDELDYVERSEDLQFIKEKIDGMR